jgi:hypothetical protein
VQASAASSRIAEEIARFEADKHADVVRDHAIPALDETLVAEPESEALGRKEELQFKNGAYDYAGQSKILKWWREEGSKAAIFLHGLFIIVMATIYGGLLTAAYVAHIVGLRSMPSEGLAEAKTILMFGWPVLGAVAVKQILDAAKPNPGDSVQ